MKTIAEKIDYMPAGMTLYYRPRGVRFDPHLVYRQKTKEKKERKL